MWKHWFFATYSEGLEAEDWALPEHLWHIIPTLQGIHFDGPLGLSLFVDIYGNFHHGKLSERDLLVSYVGCLPGLSAYLVKHDQ